MKIKCSIVTKPIKDLATQIGKSEGFTNNLVSAWQTLNQSSEYPTADQLKGMLEDKENAWEVYLAIPNYEVRDYNPEVVPIEHVNGQVYLMKLPKENPMEHFYNMYKHLPELRDLATTTEDAYRFILWREMAFMQYDLSKKAENRPIAEGEAIKKLKEWRKRYPQEKKSQGITEALSTSFKWARTAENGYEVSTRGDKRFSALVATFKEGTIIDGVDVGGRTIEDVYQSVIKKSRKGQAPAKDSKLYNESLKTKEEREDFSYTKGYLPLWQEWARQNPELMGELRTKSAGKTLTDQFANTRVSQARALAEILNSTIDNPDPKVSLSTNGYRKGDPQRHPDVNYVFTENAEAYIASHSFPLEEEPDIVFPNQGKTKLNVSDVNGTNQAGIRTDNKGNISLNAYGIVVKKYQQDANGKFVAKEGQFQDTDEDFNLFVSLNEDMFRRLSESSNKKIVFPTQMGLGKAALPKRFAEWLQSKLSTRFGINSTIEKNQRADYDGYGLSLTSVSLRLEKNEISTLNFKPEEAEFYSGAAIGSDKAWEEAATKAGIKVKNYTVADWNNLSNEWKEKLDKEYQEVVNILGRKVLDINSYAGKLVRRDMMQADKADAIFAIGTVNSEGYVDGGTGYATTRGIQRGIPVYVFDQSAGQWKMWDNNTKSFIVTTEPSLTPHAATIGTRNINDLGKQAIKSILSKIGQEGVNNSQGGVQSAPQQNVARSFSVEEAAATPAPQVVTQEEPAYKLDPNNVPKIGIESVSIDRNNPLAKVSRDFTAIQRHDRVVMIAREFSNRVDALVDEAIEKTHAALMEETAKPDEEKDYNEIVRLMTKLSTYKDSVRGRHTVIQEAKPLTIFNDMKDEFESYLDISDEELDEDYGKGQGARIKDAYRRISENFYVLLDEATVFIEAAENLRIITERHPYNTGNNTVEVTDATVTESSEDAARTEDATDDDEEGRRVDGNGGWSYKVRYVDPHSSLSKDVKKVLAGLIKLDVNGEAEVDDLGYTRYINEEYAHAILIDELSYMIDADDFSIKNEDGSYSLPALEKIADKYPWVTQIISALEAEPRLISAFYADFRKDFIPYWLQRYNENPKDGGEPRWETLQINKPVAIEATKSQITRDYEQGTQFDVDTIYAAGDVIRKDKAAIGVTLVDQLQSMLSELSEEDYVDFTEKMAKALRMVGMNVNSYIISTLLTTSEGMGDIDKVLDALKNIFTGVEEMAENAHLIDTFNEEFNTIANLIGEVSELDNIASFRQGDKTYYSYSAPNYLDTMFKTFLNNDRRQEYLDREFGRYGWFKDKKTGKWKSEWLRLIESDEQVRNHIALKEINTISRPNSKGVIENIEYSNWTPTEIKRAFIEEYFSAGYNPNSQKQYAWYNFPIFSDSPVAKFIRFVRYTGDFKSQIKPLLREVVKQEMWRMRLVQIRRAKNAREIANFDRNGDKFHFFPELNSLMVDGIPFIEAARKAAKNRDTDRLNNIIDEAISTIMEEGFSEFISNNWSGHTIDEGNLGELAESLTQQGVITNKEKINEALEEYYWNSVYATTQIIELTTTDLAFYKDGIDFQKRYKEVYAAGTKLNTNSEYGRQIERTVYLADQIITSPNYVNIKKSLDEAVKRNHITSADRDSILYKFKDINVADAQAYRHPDSMRAVLDMIGAWTPQMQESLDRFEHDDWNMTDFNTIWQTIKPFVYSQIEKPDGLGGIMKVPHQNKNSEFLLLAMYSMVANSMNQSPKLKALNRFMKDNGIDVIQFGSAVKNGGQGIIDINYSKPKLDVWLMNNSKEVKQLETALGESITSVSSFKKANDILLDRGSISQEEYNKRFKEIEPSEQEVYDTLEEYTKNKNGSFNPEVVHEIPYKDYVIQQPTPEHLFDVDNAVFGSQFRNLVISDMPDDPNFRVKINGREFTKQEVLNLYQSAIVENLLDSFSTLQERFSNIETLQKELMSQIKGNPKYGRDMVNALQLVEIDNPITGQKEKVFNIPLNNPSTTLKIQELITSMFKNAVTKQKIRGGAAILVSDFGLTDELHLVHDEDGTLVGVECYLPAYSRKFYEPFMVEKKLPNGNTYQELDINKMPLELRKIIGYRIPTEDKYSMAPLIIKGFLPQQNGSSIMVSAEITQIAGSDFDVDKMFLMIPNFRAITRYDTKKAWDDFYTQHPELVAAIEESKKQNFERALKEALEKGEKSRDEFDEDQLNALFENFISGHKNYEWVEGIQSEFSKWFKENKNNYYLRTDVEKVKYDIDAPVSSMTREQRDNMIIDIAYGILTNNDTSEKIHNPGNFDKAKKGARIASILSDTSMLSAWIDIHNFGNTGQLDFAKIGKSLLSASLDTLDDFVKKHKKERSPLTLDTFIYYHRQNMTGGALIGMYANNTTMQAKYQVTGLAIKEENTFFINRRKIHSLHDIMNENGERISKNCANFSAASVDNVKDPVLADLMQNPNTANIAGFMLRAGMSVEEISLLFSQPIIRDLITTTGSLETLNEVIKAKVRELSEMGGGVDGKINSINFTSEELISNALKWQYRNTLTDIEFSDMLASNIQAAMLVSHIADMASELSELTQISRADSPNGAIEISIAKYKNQVQKVYLYHRKSKEKDFHLTGTQDILRNGLVNSSMSRDTMREKLLAYKMPMLQSFYSLGIEMAGQLISSYFPQTNAYTDYMLAHIYDNSLKGIVSDTVLDNFYNELVEFHLTKTKLFGDDGNMTFDQKRDYYLYDFPKEFNNVIANNSDIAQIGVIKRMQVSDGEIVLRRSGRLTPFIREILMRDFDTMLYSDNSVEQKLAIDLFMYSFYKDGFKFGPNNFGTFFSSIFISSFPEFINTLRSMKYDLKQGTHFEKFLGQFYANHWDEGLVPKIYNKQFSEPVAVKTIDGKLIVNSKASFNRNTKRGSWSFIEFEGKLYRLESDSKEFGVYVEAPILSDNARRYNANMSIDEMVNVVTDQKRIDANKALNPSGSSQFDALEAMFNQFENMDMDSYDSVLSQLEGEEGMDYSEDDGQAQLDEPLCP